MIATIRYFWGDSGVRLVIFYILVMFCAIWKMIPTLNERGFWSDELFTASVIRYHPLLDLQYERKTVVQIEMDDSFLTVKAGEQHPPMYDLSLKAWASVFGDSEYSLRGFNIAIITLMLLFILFTCRPSNKSELSIIATALLLLWIPVTQSYVTQARSYMFFMMLSTLCLLAFMKVKSAYENKNAWRYTFYALATVSFLTHYYMAVFIGIIYLSIAWDDIKRKHYFLPAIPVPFVVLWIYFSYHSLLFTASGGVAWSQLSYTQSLNSMLTIMYGYFGWGLVAIVLATIFIFLKRKHTEQYIVVAILLSIGVLAFVCKKSGILHPRHFIFIIPWCIYILFNALSDLTERKTVFLLVAFLISWLSPPANSQANVYAKEEYKEAAKFISNNYSASKYKIFASWAPNEAYYKYYLDNYMSDNVDIDMLSTIRDVENSCQEIRDGHVVLYAHSSHHDIINAFKVCALKYQEVAFNGIMVIVKP
ncbi:glycosyltransferase family 39 protein [Aeromonas sp. CD]|uniref:glycosyltransferase family 39 protein n=1 Tax=Aeromonas sp. CD TaxID=3080830 RepID=UPI0029674046|nr:glycosyltransferase family 39 protein [Aeromonas sp. CD]WOX51158.1 glycosyltransferase family 39 protein [Aeromonas sp. CD]